MSNIIEELFYGNLEPQELTTELTPRLKKTLYAGNYNELSSISNSDSFISGFRLVEDVFA